MQYMKYKDLHFAQDVSFDERLYVIGGLGLDLGFPIYQWALEAAVRNRDPREPTLSVGRFGAMHIPHDYPVIIPRVSTQLDPPILPILIH